MLKTAIGIGVVAASAAVFGQPNAPDAMIRTRRSLDHAQSTVTTTTHFLKGARQRVEQLFEFPAAANPRQVLEVSIAQCDQRRTIRLNPSLRLYAIEHMPDANEAAQRRADILQRARKHGGTPATGPEVVVNIHGVDTGERRQAAGYTARHIVTTSTTVPSEHASTTASERVEDGWYIDLPPANCQPPDGSLLVRGFTSVLVPGQPPDRFTVRQTGVVASGVMVEGIVRYSGKREPSYTETTTLTDGSQQPLDGALFEVPPGYQPALPRVVGGFDLNKADTFGNRLADYWDYVASWTQGMFRAWTR